MEPGIFIPAMEIVPIPEGVDAVVTPAFDNGDGTMTRPVQIPINESAAGKLSFGKALKVEQPQDPKLEEGNSEDVNSDKK